MKKKMINKNILSFVFLLIFATIICTVRFFQLKFFTDFDIACDNFKSYHLFNLKINLKMLSYLIYSLITLYSLFLFIILFIKREKNRQFISIFEVNDKGYEKTLTTFCLILFFICTFVLSILHLLSLEKNEFFKNRIIFLMFIFQFLLPLFFLYFLYCLKYKKFNSNKILNVVFIIPVFWGVMRIFAIMFLKDFLLLTSREIVINNFKISTFTIFFFYFGKFLVGDNSKNSERNLIFFGYLSVFFGLISSVPRIMFYLYNFINKNSILSKSYEFNINIFKYKNFIMIDLIITLFILLFLIKYVFCWKKIISSN